MDLSEALKLEFFKKHGYVRKKCPICNEYFWTNDPDRKTCGEAPCEPYSFIGRRRKEKNIDEVREDFLSFMEKRGHTRVNRYPVIARWRDDLFLTSASIVDFQPFVTAGIVPPPANPLVISQPCIRMKDIDKVGLTMGRHLTIFEMMAHHAFNKPGKMIYWKEETLELFHEYAKEVLGLGEDEITYKEGVWIGGGNAGPDVEPIAGGLEIATLVFMEYWVKDSQLIPMDTKVVDTGYGLERITWFLSGRATAFDAVYGDLLSKFLRILNVERPDEKLLESYSKVSSLMTKIEAGNKFKELRKEAARIMGVDPIALDSALSPLEKAFSVLDHTKSIAFMLSDGLVPSNVDEGYLGRLLIRRALRIARSLNPDVNLSDLVVMQLHHWSRSFPELLEAEDKIAEIVDIEQKRYEETVRRGRDLIKREARKRKIDEEFLVEMYDSHGIMPEVAAEVLREEGVDVRIPDNFYELVASRHEAPKIREQEVREVKGIEEFRETELLFYKHPYMLEFEAEVLGAIGDAVILDKTAFYPEGGGQPSDTGVLLLNGEEIKVRHVEKVKGRVLHHVDKPVSKGHVKGLVDAERRLSLMRHHTATHIILGAARSVLGKHVWQTGAQKGVEESRLDITHYKQIEPEELREIEVLANRIVMENREVKQFFMPRDEAEKKYGFVLYQGGVVPDPVLRIVEVDGFNVQACAGTHVMRTGEIGPIKIWRSRRIQDGVVRLEFSAGMPAVRKLIDGYEKLKEIAEKLGTGVEGVDDAFNSLLASNKSLIKELREERRKRLEFLVEKEVNNSVIIGNIKFVSLATDIADRSIITDVLDKFTKENGDLAILLVEGGNLYLMVGGSTGIKASEVLKNAVSKVGGRAGGSDLFATGSTTASYDEIRRALLEQIRKAGK
ncbi:MAG: alanine--tRNA ligase [Candidatus Methanodesulfokora sp.]